MRHIEAQATADTTQRASQALKREHPLSLLSSYRVILGSQSPRRAELLSGLDIDFVQKPMPDIDESYPDTLPHEQIASYIAQRKAEAYRPRMQARDLVVTADTIVLCPASEGEEAEALGKPQDRADAERMLQRLSGRKHYVVTGYCLTTLRHQIVGSSLTIVDFAPLRQTDISYYLDHYAPYDKAGAYGIQEWIGYKAVRGIEGSYYNVMGLPIQLLSEDLQKLLEIEQAESGGEDLYPEP